MISVNFLPLQARRDRALDATPGGSQARFGTVVVNERHEQRGTAMKRSILGGLAAAAVAVGLASAATANKRPCEANIALPANWGLPVMTCRRGRGDPGRRPLGVQAARETGTEERLDTLNPYLDAVKDHPLTRPRRGPGGCEGRGQN